MHMVYRHTHRQDNHAYRIRNLFLKFYNNSTIYLLFVVSIYLILHRFRNVFPTFPQFYVFILLFQVLTFCFLLFSGFHFAIKISMFQELSRFSICFAKQHIAFQIGSPSYSRLSVEAPESNPIYNIVFLHIHRNGNPMGTVSS